MLGSRSAWVHEALGPHLDNQHIQQPRRIVSEPVYREWRAVDALQR